MPRYTTQPSPSLEQANISNRDMLKAEFARRLYKAIMDRGWTQSQFARTAGLNRDAISTYVRGKSMPSPQALQSMADVLGVRPEWLMPNYYEAAQEKTEPTIELRELPNSEGYMWLRLNMRLPKPTALKILALAQEHT